MGQWTNVESLTTHIFPRLSRPVRGRPSIWPDDKRYQAAITVPEPSIPALVSSPVLLLFRPPSLCLPDFSQIRGSFDPQFVPQLIHIPLQLLLPVDINDFLLGRPAVPQRPRQIHLPEPPPFTSFQPQHGCQAQPRHGQERVGELKGLQRHLPFHDDGQTRQGVVEVVAFPVPLHDVGAFFVVDVAYLRSRVRGDALAIEPGGVGVSDGVGREGTETGQGERAGGYAWSVAEDPTAGGVREHGGSEALDEVRGCRCFTEGGDDVCVNSELASGNAGVECLGIYLLVED